MRNSLFVTTATAALTALFLSTGAMAQDELILKHRPQGGGIEQTVPAKSGLAGPQRLAQADCQAGEANCPPKKPKAGAGPAETTKPKMGQQDVQEPAKAGEAPAVKPKMGQQDVQEPAKPKVGQQDIQEPAKSKVGQADCKSGDEANCPPKKQKMGAQPAEPGKAKVGQQDTQEPAKAGEATPLKPKVGQKDVQEPAKTGEAAPVKPEPNKVGQGECKTGDEASCPPKTPNKMGAQPAEPGKPKVGQQETQPANPTQTGQTTGGEASGKVEVTGSLKIAPDKAERVHDTLIRTGERTDIDVTINIGTPLPERVRPRPLPTTIIEIAPEYRGYDYVIIRDEIVIVEPKTRRVVEVLHQGRGQVQGQNRVGTSLRLTAAQRAKIIAYARQQRITSVQAQLDLQTGAAVPTDIDLVRLPDEIVTEIPDIQSYEFFVDSDQVVLVDPQSRKIVEVVE